MPIPPPHSSSGAADPSKPDVNPWLLVRPKPNARLRLFCFPYAGSGASQFLPWTRKLPEEVDVCPIQLPGRESRSRETPFNRIGPLMQSLAPVIEQLSNLPCAFFGHSMGAIVSFELALELRRRGGRAPRRLFLSGHRAPHMPEREPHIHSLSDPDLKAKLAELNGCPREFLENEELMSIYLPIIRTDAAVCETYEFKPGESLECPFTVLGGLEDEKVNQAELDGWAQHTSGPCDVRTFPGDHFYLHGPSSASLLRILSGQLQDLMA